MHLCHTVRTMNTLNRRSFLAVSSTGLLTLPAFSMPHLLGQPLKDPGTAGDNHRGPCVIASGNGLAATDKAMSLINKGMDPVDAVVAGVSLVEDDPNDMSVGFGGLPNERGVVQLDSSVMHGPTHKAGAVGALEDIRSAARVALDVLKKTDHVMIVGQGARDFALAQGFEPQNMLTDKARQAWLRWKANLSPNDDWLDDIQRDIKDPAGDLSLASTIPFTWGTINCSGLDSNGNLASVTTTSGLSYKIPGRVGDSPIVGAGMFCDNDIGAAGATGRGEAVIQNCGAFSVVQHMASGKSPTEACLAVLKRIASRTRQKRLLNARGQPNFNVMLYALRKDGAFGAAAMRGKRTFAVHDGKQNTLHTAPSLY